MEEKDYSALSLEELEKLLVEYQKKSSDFHNEEQGVKLTLNSIYGALGNKWFSLANIDVAESVTLQGQDIWKFAEKIINRYFNELWHLDTEVHEKMGIKNVRPLNLDFIIYGDTDSSHKSTLICTKYDKICEKVRFDELFSKFSKKNPIYLDDRGNQIIEPFGLSAGNSKDGNFIFSPVKKIIRHRVRKAKWKIVTNTGKEVIVTNDHSVTVFRNGEKIHIKPCEMNINTDKVLEVSINL